MNNKFIAALVCLGMTGAASAADVDFDKGVDLSKTIEQAVTLQMPHPGQPGYGSHQPGPGQWVNHWKGTLVFEARELKAGSGATANITTHSLSQPK